MFTEIHANVSFIFFGGVLSRKIHIHVDQLLHIPKVFCFAITEYFIIRIDRRLISESTFKHTNLAAEVKTL